jgi:hypothetical protein
MTTFNTKQIISDLLTQVADTESTYKNMILDIFKKEVPQDELGYYRTAISRSFNSGHSLAHCCDDAVNSCIEIYNMENQEEEEIDFNQCPETGLNYLVCACGDCRQGRKDMEFEMAKHEVIYG